MGKRFDGGRSGGAADCLGICSVLDMPQTTWYTADMEVVQE